jgi:surface protein
MELVDEKKTKVMEEILGMKLDLSDLAFLNEYWKVFLINPIRFKENCNIKLVKEDLENERLKAKLIDIKDSGFSFDYYSNTKEVVLKHQVSDSDDVTIYSRYLFNDTICKTIITDRLSFKEHVKHIRIGGFCRGSIDGLFEGLTNLEQVEFTDLETLNLTSMSRVFKDCFKLEEIYLGKFCTPHVTSMSGLFWNCVSLKKIDVLTLSTITVNDMSRMFASCSKLKEIDLRSFNTSNVINMTGMFEGCTSLKKLDLSKFDTQDVLLTDCMFSGCMDLEEIDLSNARFDSLRSSNYMFGVIDLDKVKLSDNIRIV